MVKHYDSKVGISYMGLVYPYGGATELPGYRGISHLMEHLMCKTYDDLRCELRSSGIVTNAYTSNLKTVFWFKGLDEELIKFQQKLLDGFVEQNKLWTKEEFEAEKKTVIQEYKDCFNDQLIGSIYNFSRKHYGEFGPIGLLIDIESFTYEESIEMAKNYKVNFDLYTVGNKLLNETNEDINLYENHEVLFNEQGYPNPIDKVIKEDKTVVGLISKKVIGIDRVSKIDLIIGCINQGLESPLYQEIREKRGLSYYSYGYCEGYSKSFFPFFFSCTTNDRVDELKNVYVDFFSKDLKDIVSKERFEVCKQNKKIKEKMNRILFHDGINIIELSDYNPYEGISELSYDDAIELSSEYLNKDNLFLVSY